MQADAPKTCQIHVFILNVIDAICLKIVRFVWILFYFLSWTRNGSIE